MSLIYALFVSPPSTEPLPLSEPLGLDQLAERSEQVVLGEVTNVWVEPVDGTPWTVASVLVEESMIGEADRLIEVRWPGGEYGQMELTVSGAPDLHAGDRAVFFVDADSRVVGLSQGVLHVENTDFLRRDLSGLAYGTEVVSAPEAFTLQQVRAAL